MMAASRSNPQLTEKQSERLKELDSMELPTDKQRDEMAVLNLKKANGSKVILSSGYIEYLMEHYAWTTEQMVSVSKETMTVLAMEKGKRVEPKSVELLCRHDKALYKDHKERISNDFLSGEIDIYLGESVMEATNVTDIKSSFDYPTFLKKIHNGLENGQREQVGGYCDITQSPVGFIANCLVDTPDELILDTKYQFARKMGSLTIESPDFLEQWAILEHSMRFSHMAVAKRVHKIPVELFTEFEKQQIYDRVKVGREFLWKFDEERQKLN